MSKKFHSFTVLEDGFLNGLWQQKGDTVSLTDAQAGLFLQHGRLTPARSEPVKAEPAKKG